MKRKTNSHRDGVVLVVVIVALLVATSLAALAIQATLRAQRERRFIAQSRQTELLVDAGIALAVDQLQKDPNYTGEVWDVSAAVSKEKNAAVTVKVEVSESSRLVEVIARIEPRELSQQATQSSHRFHFNLREPTALATGPGELE